MHSTAKMQGNASKRPFANANSANSSNDQKQFESAQKDKQLFFKSYFSLSSLYKYLTLRSPVFLFRNLHYASASIKKKKISRILPDDLFMIKQVARNLGFKGKPSSLVKKAEKHLKIQVKSLNITNPLFIAAITSNGIVQVLFTLRVNGEVRHSEVAMLEMNLLSPRKLVLQRNYIFEISANFLAMQSELGVCELFIEILDSKELQLGILNILRKESKFSPLLYAKVRLYSTERRKIIYSSHLKCEVKFYDTMDANGKSHGTIQLDRIWEFSLSNNSKENLSFQREFRESFSSTNMQLCYYFYYDNKNRLLKEKYKSPLCCWCNLLCNSIESLILHLLCSHDRFKINYRTRGHHEIGVYPADYSMDIGFPNSFGFFAGSLKSGTSWYKNYIMAQMKVIPDICTHENDVAIISEKRDSERINVKRERDDSFASADGNKKVSIDTKKPVTRDVCPISPSTRRNNKESKSDTGNMRYYHTPSFSLIHEKEVFDSDHDVDESWKLDQNIKMIDEFNDVSFSEKEVMKLWNKFVFNNPITADFRVSRHAFQFCETYKDFIKRNHHLRNAVLLHFMAMWEFGILQMEDISSALQLVDSE
jgi:hypothetical protein